MRDIEVGDRLVPLETDLTTPLAYYLNNPTLSKTDYGTMGLLQAGRNRSRSVHDRTVSEEKFRSSSSTDFGRAQ